MDTPSANIIPTEPSGGKDCTTASVAKAIAVETEPTPESRLLPELLGAELWRTAGAESVEVSKAEFSQALETIGVRDNFGLLVAMQPNLKSRISLAADQKEPPAKRSPPARSDLPGGA